MGTKLKKNKKVKPTIEVDDNDFTYEDDISEMPDIDFDKLTAAIEDIDDAEDFIKSLIFGEQGTGKTTFAGTMPKPVLFLDCNERGTKVVKRKGHKRVKIRSKEQLEMYYWYLYTQKHPYKGVVIDSTTLMADIIMAGVLKEDGREGGLPHKGNWGDSVAAQRNLLIRFRNLPMHVTFIAQLKRLNEDDLEDEDDKTKVPMLSPAVRSLLGAAVDVIGYTYIKEVEKEVKGKLKTEYQYRMRIGPSSSILTKIRTQKGVKYPAVLVDPTFDKIYDIMNKEAEK